jgi:hypothetical protein
MHHSSHGVIATETGDRLYVRAQAIPKQVPGVKTVVAQSNAQLSGTLAFGIP